MKFKDFKPSLIQLPAGQNFYRVQLTRARKTSVRINGLLLSPTGLKTGRFCLDTEPTAYMADSEHTALYESMFRRDIQSRSLSDLAKRSLAKFSNKAPLRLADLRSLAATYPVLQAQRFSSTQAFAKECRQHDLDGIIYESAQHPHHTCVAVFESGIAKLKKVSSLPLVKPNSRQLLRCVTEAARRSAVPLMDE
jgi:hypothetical protein